MNAELVIAASKIVHNQQILVNMVSRRVRQFTLGHRPMVEFTPGLGNADVALMEIATGKLSFELKVDDGVAGAVEVVEFPGVIVSRKAKRAA